MSEGIKHGKPFGDGKAIDRALKEAVRDAVVRHRQLGLPLATWRDGKVVWIAPEEIPVDDETTTET